MSSQKAQTGGADFVVEHADLDAATFGLRGGENGGALLHHPPLVRLLVRCPVDLLQSNGHGPEESQRLEVWTLWRLWGEKIYTESKASFLQSFWQSFISSIPQFDMVVWEEAAQSKITCQLKHINQYSHLRWLACSLYQRYVPTDILVAILDSCPLGPLIYFGSRDWIILYNKRTNETPLL